jgi:hypothetical protein
MRIAAVLLVLPLLAACAAPPMYEDPKRVGRVDKLREQRDLCLIQNIPQFDDRSADPKKVGDYVAMSCQNETTKLVEMAIPYPSRHDRDAFQQEAVFRATGYVMTARRMETDSVDRQHQQPQPQQPTPLQ